MITLQTSGVAGTLSLATPLHQQIVGPLIVAAFVVFIALVVLVEVLDRRATRRHRGVLDDLKRKPYRNPDRVARLAKNGRLRKDLRS